LMRSMLRITTMLIFNALMRFVIKSSKWKQRFMITSCLGSSIGKASS
jgi:hypothetical protein